MRVSNRRPWFLLALVVALLVGTQSTAAQGPRILAYTSFTTDVTLTTTTETVIVSSGPVVSVRDTTEVVVIAWAQLTTGAATTTVTPRIRRGTTTAATLVGEANAETVKAAAGSTEPFVALVTEQIAGAGNFQYSLTLAQASATGNGSALHGGIVVLAR